MIDYLACTFLISLVGFPAISIPATWTDSGLPVGVQLVARPGEDELLLDVAQRLGTSSGFHHRWPDETTWTGTPR
ncbi:amidase family protein [Saccharopolyspora sp. 5N102]|uniref:amidase family protein n=1 Tax=Saccharopolyspora sp. 5N102 TaxID=3375155 RepID=UPI0037971314